MNGILYILRGVPGCGKTTVAKEIAMSFELSSFDVEKYENILSRGLCSGVGNPDGQMCIEAAICNVLGLPHSDDPKCVAHSVRSYKIALNDTGWSSDKSRAKGLAKLGLAQLGSLGTVDSSAFVERLAELHTQILIPKLFRMVLSDNKNCMKAAAECENNPSIAAANALSVRVQTHTIFVLETGGM